MYSPLSGTPAFPFIIFDQREKSNPPPLEEISRSARNDWTVALPQSCARATMALDLFAETKGLS